MEGWRPVEEWGFGQRPVVMANEAHDGLARSVWQFREMSSIDPFVIDQTVTVAWDGEPRPWARDLLGSLADVLAAHGGTAAILREQAPPPLDQRDNVDALVVSTDNALTEDGA